MDKVVDIRKRIQNKKQGELLKQYREKIETLGQIIQCSSCHLKCAMCGEHIQRYNVHKHLRPAGLTLCASCRDEYEDFISLSKGNEDPEIFWHNKEWSAMWSAWLNYRKAIIAFMKSPEFKLLVKELDRDPSV